MSEPKKLTEKSGWGSYGSGKCTIAQPALQGRDAGRYGVSVVQEEEGMAFQRPPGIFLMVLFCFASRFKAV